MHIPYLLVLFSLCWVWNIANHKRANLYRADDDGIADKVNLISMIWNWTSTNAVTQGWDARG